MQIDEPASRIDYLASKHLRNVVLSLGRTEDVRFSPSQRRLAVAGFIKNKITVFEVSIAVSGNSKSISLTGATEISSNYLNNPHGLDFIDEERILVANRGGQACIFELPLDAKECCELAPLAILQSDDISTPGSAVVTRNEKSHFEALICNSYSNSVTRHLLDAENATSKVLLKKWLDIPDGICVNREQQWIAVSNHSTENVLLFENKPSLNESTDPIGILRGINYPHGLRFTLDGHFILVADAGSPYVKIYERGDSDWRGVHDPLSSFRVLNNEDFLRGSHTPSEGGPKGIDVHAAQKILVTTCECQPLAFFDLAAILEGARARKHLRRRQKSNSAEEKLNNTNHYKRAALEVSCQLYLSRLKTYPSRLKTYLPSRLRIYLSRLKRSLLQPRIFQKQRITAR